ncbi:type II toxin-antitoxin system mRNA interferase toxin, RelE/StbE family [Candidatus Peregrinibacteria bacterium CG11_big_fil_rev_8_21_14_0_20_41_10]|nr:MAG: type II toxin-antitoxin system mRNA interferase toxin, RelE/StbE family [Candidatus Peregrinibacteria bacterium CG11_big_fil_rev_8_21_14_0_20_41_10]PIZ73672.1 MAG: type II toxin-antitoxin system mRNA interferase toxin, RelE/StbE family [Candidatus Peregrinibacteria bacterium CG_4_10_14_0_2_um_filter_41_8]PJC37711.1 MAG: type II toxin-antitoxin system mRNA interferase toxin, RelE/StbE family [Candidatus Peregrinibacteria bacterium CG_4_9_14_0_2_um_filter_41_14]
MQIFYTKNFKRKLQHLPVKLQAKFITQLNLLLDNPRQSTLKVHPLKGNLAGLRAFSVTGDCRVVYKIQKPDTIILIDIGSHSQVY